MYYCIIHLHIPTIMQACKMSTIEFEEVIYFKPFSNVYLTACIGTAEHQQYNLATPTVIEKHRFITENNALNFCNLSSDYAVYTNILRIFKI